MSCGFQGSTPAGFYNTHFIGLRNIHLPFQESLPWRIQNWINQYNMKYFHYTGGVLGTFMREIRMADLNFITADWVGWGSRGKRKKSGYPRALSASRDPVALDYVSSQRILLPLTRSNTDNRYLIRLNDASIQSGPFHKKWYCGMEAVLKKHT